MKNLHDDMLTQLRDRLRGYEENPDDQLWAAIQQSTKIPAAFDWLQLTSNSLLVASFVAVIFMVNWSGNVPAINKVQESLQQESSATFHLPNQATQQVNAQTNIEDHDKFKEASPISKPTLIVENDMQVKTKAITTQTVSLSSSEINQPIETVKDSSTITNQPNIPASLNNQNLKSTVELDSLFTSNKKKVDSAATTITPIILPAKKIRRGIHFTVAFTPTLAFHGIAPSANDNIIITRVLSPAVLSTDRVGLGGSLGVQGFINNKLEYFVSLSYYQQNHTVQYFYRHDSDNSVEKIGTGLTFGVKPVEHAAEIQYKMKNIGMQIGFLYLLKEGRLSQKVGAGIDFQKGFQKQIQNEWYDNANSTYLSYQLIYRNEYRVNSTLKLFVQPAFSYPIKINEKMSGPLQLKQYTVSVSFGVIFQIK